VLSLGCVMVTLVFFMFTPRMEAGVFGRSNILNQPLRSGLDEGVNLSRGGTIAGDEETVFLARFPREATGKPPTDDTGGIYWRVTSYNKLVGDEWSRDPGELEFHEWRTRDRGVLERVTAGQGNRLVEQEIFLESTTDRVGVPAMPLLTKIIPPDGTRFLPDDWDPFTIRIGRSSSQSFSYQAISELLEFTEGELSSAPANYAEEFTRNRNLTVYTSHRLSGRSAALARNLTANLDSPYEKALAIEAYLQSTEFLYTNTLEELPEDDPVDAFLFVRKAGHCELYASSMCMLVRSLGIPARVASGYKTTAFDWSEDDGGYIVRKRNAHLWVEVYLIGVGWRLFDPSGILEMDNSLLARLQRWFTRNVLNLKIMYYRDIVGFNSGIDLGNLISFSIGLVRFDVETMRSALPSLGMFAQGLPRAMLILALALAAFWGLFVMYRSAALRRRHAAIVQFTEDQIRATRMYSQLKRRLHALGVNGHTIGARELFSEVESNLPEQRETVLSLVQTYNDARFGGRPLNKEHYIRLVRDVRGIRKPRPAK